MLGGLFLCIVDCEKRDQFLAVCCMGRYLTNTEAHDIARSVVANFSGNIILVYVLPN